MNGNGLKALKNYQAYITKQTVFTSSKIYGIFVRMYRLCLHRAEYMICPFVQINVAQQLSGNSAEIHFALVVRLFFWKNINYSFPLILFRVHHNYFLKNKDCLH